MSVDKTASETISRAGWGILLTVGFGVAVVIMDATIVNVASPVVMVDLGLSAADAQWLNASYALTFAALLITVGRLGDINGRRRMFAAGIALFIAASVVAGSAGGAGVLIAARFLQGVGAAMVVPDTLSILGSRPSPAGRATSLSPCGGRRSVGWRR